MRRSLTLFFSFAAVLLCADLAHGVCGPGADTLPGGRINVGLNGSNFTVFGVAGFSDTNTYTNNTFTGPSFVQGNIGIGPNGTFSWSDGTIDGDVYMDGSGGFTMSGPAHFTSPHMVKYNQHTVLSSAFMDYQNLSNAANNECDTPPGGYTVNGSSTTTLTNVNITNASQSMIVKDPFGGSKIVLHLNNFIMSAGTFTLEGTATTTYIINVKNQFSLNNAKILLANSSGIVGSSSGVQASNVLFNIRSKGIQISLNQGAQMSGVLLALGDKVDLSGGKVNGRVIGGQVNITSGGQVISR